MENKNQGTIPYFCPRCQGTGKAFGNLFDCCKRCNSTGFIQISFDEYDLKNKKSWDENEQYRKRYLQIKNKPKMVNKR